MKMPLFDDVVSGLGATVYTGPPAAIRIPEEKPCLKLKTTMCCLVRTWLLIGVVGDNHLLDNHIRLNREQMQTTRLASHHRPPDPMSSFNRMCWC